MKIWKNKESGGAALEYVIVSAFGIVLSMTAVGFIAKIFKEKMSEVQQQIEQSNQNQIKDQLGDF